MLAVSFDPSKIADLVKQLTGIEFKREDYEEDFDYEDALWDTVWKICKKKIESKWDIISSDYYNLIGKKFEDSGCDGYCLDGSVTGFEQLVELAKEIEEMFGEKPKLYTGEYGC